MNKYDEVIESCKGLIYMIAKKFNNYDVEDLFQVGALGVIKAYDNYKKDKMTKFSTYAYKYIYGEMYAYVKNTNTVKIPKETYQLYKKINEAKNILSQRLMKEPSLYELAAFLEIDSNIIETVYLSMEKIDSLDRVIYSDGKNVELFDTLKDNKDHYNIDYLLLNDELNKLEDEEKKIIYLRYFEDKTQSEVAEILGINQVQVSRSETKTLKKIRQNYQNVA